MTSGQRTKTGVFSQQAWLPRYRYGVAFAVVIAATAIRLVFLPALEKHAPFVTFYPAVMIAALYGGLWTGLLTTVLSVLASNYFFMEPFGRFIIRERADWLSMVVFFLSCMMISFITEGMRRARAGLIFHQKNLEEMVSARTKELEREITERKLAEDELQEREQRLKFHFENSPLAVVEWDAGFIVTQWSSEAERIFGWKKDEILGKRIDTLNIIYDEDIPIVNRIMERLTSGKELTVVSSNRNFNKSGGVIECTWHNSVLLDQKGQMASVMSLVQDVTERNKAEKALQVKHEELTAANEELQAQTEELNAIYNELQCQTEKIQQHAEATARARDEAERWALELDATISSIAAGVIIYNHLGNVTRINEFACNILEYTSNDYNLPYQERPAKLKLCKPDGTPYEKEEAPLYRALRGEVIRDEEIMIAKIPEPKWLSATFAPIYGKKDDLIGVILIFNDITERKRKAADLLASERELLKVTLNSIGEGVVAIDREARIIFINETVVNLIGCSQDKAIGQPFEKVFYVFDDSTSEPIDIRIPQKHESNLKMLAGDLFEVPISLNCSPIKAPDGQIIGTVAVFQDISERLKTQQELAKADKLESLGVLAGGISHDFNNILGAILSNIQLAMMKMEKHQDPKIYLSRTVETTRKASELTKQLLTFSKGGAPVRKNASLIELIKDTAEFALRGTKVKVEFEIPGNLWPASIDEGQISQVIHNLVINAQQAMLRGGLIRISAENITLAAESHFKSDNYVKIAIQDQGVGIPKENLGKIFDPFFTTKEDGNGLGLATSYSIIRHHEGFMDVESQEGIGTTFYIYLPALDGAFGLLEASKEVASSGLGFKVLLMDDEESILNAVGEMLSEYGYQVVLTTDGVMTIKAYQDAKLSGVPFDAVIMDLTVPGGMGGQETIAILRDFDPKIKAIISSGYANDPIIADYERFGFMGMVNKPYKIDELNEILLKVINPNQLSLGLRY